MMKNDLYHGFVPGFNAWYVLLPLFLLAIVIFSSTCLMTNKKGTRILSRDKEDYVLHLISIVFDVIIHIFIVAESGVGLIQFLINMISDDSDAAWVIFLLPITLIGTAFLGYGLFFGTGKLTKFLKRYYLERKIYGDDIE